MLKEIGVLYNFSGGYRKLDGKGFYCGGLYVKGCSYDVMQFKVIRAKDV